MGSALSLLTADSQHKIAQSKIDAQRTLIASNNEKEAATTSLARFNQSLANQRKLQAGGANYNAATINLAAKADANTTGNFQQKIADAEALGTAVVSAAAAGVGGSSVDTYQRTMQLRQSINEESRKRAQDAAQVNGAESRAAIIADTVAQLDNTQYAANIDYTQLIDHREQKNVFGAFVAAAVATYFGGPQAGQAVLDVADAGGKLQNNDQAGASQRLSSAGANAMAGMQYWSAKNAGSDTKVTDNTNVAQGLQLKSSGQTASGFWGKGGSEGYRGYSLY